MLLTKVFRFSAAHKLVGNVGEPLHGHTYKMEVTIKDKVNDVGMVYDFRTLKNIVDKKVIEKLDHTYLNDTFKQPTVENVAIWIWNELKKEINLNQIRVWESPDAYVTYNGEE